MIKDAVSENSNKNNKINKVNSRKFTQYILDNYIITQLSCSVSYLSGDILLRITVEYRSQDNFSSTERAPLSDLKD